MSQEQRQYDDHDLLVRIDERVDTILEKVKEQNGRVKAIELWKANLKGKLAIIAVVGGAAAGLILELIKKHIL